MAQQNASVALGMVQQKYQKDFDRYGPEIHGIIASIPVEGRSLDVLERAVKLVRADHVDELATEQAQRLVTQMVPTVRPTGGAALESAPTTNLSVSNEALPAVWRDRAKAAQLSDREVAEFCHATGTPIDKFFADLQNGKIMTAAATAVQDNTFKARI